MTENIDFALDQFIKNKDYDFPILRVVNDLVELPNDELGSIMKYIEKQRIELEDMQNDEQLSEAYSCYSMKQLSKLLAFFQVIEYSCENMMK